MVHKRRNRGVGLVDLLITLALVAIVATMAIPEGSTATDAVKLDMTVKEIKKQLDGARLAAITKNSRMMVVFNASTGIYRVQRDNSGTWEKTDMIGYLPDGVDFLATRAIVFENTGLAETAGSVTLRADEKQVQVLVSTAGGVSIP